MTPGEAAALHAASFPPADRWGADAFGLLLDLPGHFAHHIPGTGFILARVAGGEAEILTLAVVPDARREGHASALLAACIASAAAAGAGAMFLEVAEGNAAARGLYAACGFAEVGRRRRYYPDGADALVLRLSLPS